MIRAIVRWSVTNSVAANLVMAAIVLGGFLAYASMPREVFPDFSLGKVELFTIWPGAGPGDVEELVTVPLEEAVADVDGVDELQSVSREGVSRVYLTLAPGADLNEVLAQVRDRIGRGDLELPEQAEPPVVREQENVFPVLAVFVHGTASRAVLVREADRIQRELETLAGVQQVVLTGKRDERLWVELDPSALEDSGLSFAEVRAVLGARLAEAPVGSLDTDSGEWLLRVRSEVGGAGDLLELPLAVRPDGSRTLLADVARVTDTFDREITRARFNGEPCLHLQVNKDADADLIDLAGVLRGWVEEQRAELAPGVQLGTNSDLSVYVRERLAVMTESGLMGGVLVLACLLAFLDRRVALWTALGIPIAFLGGIAVSAWFGVSMNMMTMFALIVVLGMVVDDAIVVGENTFRLIEEGHSPEEAAIEGGAQVGGPVVATILTSVAAFLPVLMLEGQAGLFMRPLPLVVSACLFVSLVEALVVLPAHLAHGSGGRRTRAQVEAAREPWYEPLRRAYVRLLEAALRWRWTVVGGALGLLTVVGALAVHRVPFVFFDDFESKIFYVSARLVPDAGLDDAEAVARELEERCLELPATELESVNSMIGLIAQDAANYELGQNLAQVWVELREGEQRTMAAPEVVRWLRERMAGASPLVESLQIDQPQAGLNGRAIELVLRGRDHAALGAAAEEVRSALATYAGVRDLRSSVARGKREVLVRPTPEGRLLGVSEAWLTSEVRTALEGAPAGSFRRGTEDVEVFVKLPEELRADAGALQELTIGTPAGPRVRLADVAAFDERAGPASLQRRERERSITLTADIDKSLGNAREVVDDLLARFADLEQTHAGTTLEPLGDHEETARSLEGLGKAGLLALGLIFAVLGTLFRSYLQPLVIMSIVPFALLGVVLGHLVMGRDMTLLSLIGLLALCGVVVNDSLILVDFVNQARAQGMERLRSVVEASRLRFRPILLTSITTMAGLTPLTFFASGQARFLQPMAISVFFGLAVATVLVLVVVPCIQACLDDLLLGRAQRDPGAGSVASPLAYPDSASPDPA
jgi:multidrug efflux pump subunit AcrB